MTGFDVAAYDSAEEWDAPHPYVPFNPDALYCDGAGRSCIYCGWRLEESDAHTTTPLTVDPRTTARDETRTP